MTDPRLIVVLAAIAMTAGAAIAQPAGPVPDGVVPAHSRPAVPGPVSNFTGRVSVRPVVDAGQMGSASIGEVRFEPGARSNWHSHPAGQALYVVDGCGWTQREGGPVVRICRGDTAFVPAGVRHWHGATRTTAMTHVAITESRDGRNVDWMEPVADVQYRGE